MLDNQKSSRIQKNHQNWIICSSDHDQHLWKILLKSADAFLSYFGHINQTVTWPPPGGG